VSPNRPLIALAVLIILPLIQANNRRDILFIAIDDLNDWVGPLGNSQAKTCHKLEVPQQKVEVGKDPLVCAPRQDLAEEVDVPMAKVRVDREQVVRKARMNLEIRSHRFPIAN